MSFRSLILSSIIVLTILPFHLQAASDDGDIALAANIGGYAYLEGETDHSGIMIEFIAESPSAITDTAYTTSDGSYTFSVADGVYEIKFSKDGYLTYTYPETPTLSGDETLNDVTLQAGIVVSGNIWDEVWEEGSTILVEDDISLSWDDTLIIEPGVKVKFNGNYSFWIGGYLLAVGTESDSIVFTSNSENPAPGDWKNLIIDGWSTKGRILSYCRFEYGGSESYSNNNGEMIAIDNASIVIENSNISNSNQDGINIASGDSVFIINNKISNNYEGIDGNSDYLLIQENKIYNNYVAIDDPSGFIINNNIIFNNIRGGIYKTGSYTGEPFNVITGNKVFGHNGYEDVGIQAYHSYIKNNIVYNNYEGIRSGNLVHGNKIFSNEVGLIYCQEAVNNTLENNTIGIKGGYAHTYIMNIISNSDIGISNMSSDDVFQYNLFGSNLQNYDQTYGGFGEVITTNQNGDSTDTYYNLFMDPQFVSTDTASDNFLHLSSTSPAIDAGHPDSLDADSTIRDIGAFFFDQGGGGTIDPPVADFSADPLEGTQPLFVQFQNASTGPVTGFNWNFGDNTSSSMANPVHAYQDSGVYSVSLTVSGPGGVDTDVKTDYITVNPPQNTPVVNFSASATSGTSPFTVDFTSTVENDVDSLRWYFGDGGTSTAANPSYTYSTAGTFTVTLTAYGPYGEDTETKTDYISVFSPEQVSADFTALPTEGVAPMGVQFTNTSVGTIDSVLWDFGDGASSTVLNPAHEYQSAGTYSVTLIVYGQVNTDSLTKESLITVYDARPVITEVADVPNDQGGKVLLRWEPSGFDGPVGTSVNQYSLWQRYEDEWVSINNTLATQSSTYTYLANTFGDSTTAGIHWSKFKIIAHTSTPSTYYTSPVDSGYSVDNVPPAAPGQLLASLNGENVDLQWGSSNESNFMYYKVQRNWVTVQEQTASEYTDAPTSFDTPLYYTVNSVDDAGNESPPTNEVLIDNTNLDWFVNIRAETMDGVNDNDNFLGTASDATNAHDSNYDIVEPPSPPDTYLSLAFPHPEWNYSLGDDFTQDVKPTVSLSDTHQIWAFDVTADHADSVTLTFLPSDGFPDGATMLLTNQQTSEALLISSGDTCTFDLDANTTKSFTVRIGNNVPKAPTDFTINAPATTGFGSLSWTDNAIIEGGFLVYGSSDGSTYSILDSLTANATTYTGDTLQSLEPNTRYWFGVQAYNVVDASAMQYDSLYTLALTPDAPIIVDSTLTTLDITLATDDNPDSTEYAIAIGEASGGPMDYLNPDGTLNGENPAWATAIVWDTVTAVDLTPVTTYNVQTLTRNGDLVETDLSQTATGITGAYPTITLHAPSGPEIVLDESLYSMDWTITNKAFVETLFIDYSGDNGGTYYPSDTTTTFDNYSWRVASEILNYNARVRVRIKDEAGNIHSDESPNPFVIVANTLSTDVQTGWTLWGVPLDPTDTTMIGNLENDFSGGYWAYGYSDGGYTIENNLHFGAGYWLAVENGATVDVTGDPATTEMLIETPQGWNLVTNPLVIPMPKDSLLVSKDQSTVSFDAALDSGWVSNSFYHYNPSQGGYTLEDTLQPWGGYWTAIAASGVSLQFPVIQVTSPQQTAPEGIQQQDSLGWYVQLHVTSGEVTDDILLGAHPDATDAFGSEEDAPKPPIPPTPSYTYMDIQHPGWHPVFGDKYMIDIRSPLTEEVNKVWEVNLQNEGISEPVTLEWTTEQFPAGMELGLRITDLTVDMLSQESYTFPEDLTSTEFQVVAGQTALATGEESTLPTEFTLRQNYPNPFNPSTTIKYGLPKAADVRLVVYNVTGQRIATLVNEHKAPGWYHLEWEGTDDVGHQVSNGVYFYRIRAEEFTEVRKMIYLK
ncbi:MAG: PKD domain-containing protein [Candidatus Marinimicrobia bacterium]|nr:PKD domain-containing protein [Candidatus Neomarinimicrobiota bacterium]MCF7880173.1 PKD domain-containing protein [Candidatus Neomarinimicrobiota bacterium]